MSSGLFKNNIIMIYIYIYIYIYNLELNSPQRLICHKTHPNNLNHVTVQTNDDYYQIESYLKPYNCVQIICTKKSFIGLMGRVFTNGPGDWGSIPGRVILKT